MAPRHPVPAASSHPSWDITFTRLTQTLRPQLDACMLGLARRFQAMGVGSEMQVRQTPRGLSSFLALIGERGLIGFVDLTLVDGLGLGQAPSTQLDVRLPDGCGALVALGLAEGVAGRTALETAAAQALLPEFLMRVTTAVYLAALAHFELQRPTTRDA